MPRRVQLKRTKGWRLPPNTVVVSRGPGRKWGNPFRGPDAVKLFRSMLRLSQPKLLDLVSPDVALGLALICHRERIKREIGELRGKNLACWCALNQPCHADVLLEIANA